jgi:cytidylate kinase
MNEPIFGRCLSFINSQIKLGASGELPADDKIRWRTITISRQSGTGAHLVADAVARNLQSHASQGADSWMVFDRNLLEKVLEEHHLPARLARFMPEDRISGIEDALDELFGLHPPTWTLVEKISDTILRLADLGHVILLGRGASVIAGKLPHAFHVRLVGSFEARTEFVQADRHLDKKKARELIAREDEGRRRYLKRYFHKDVDDHGLYHLEINTPLVGHETAARLIADAVLSTAHS